MLEGRRIHSDMNIRKLESWEPFQMLLSTSRVSTHDSSSSVLSGFPDRVFLETWAVAARILMSWPPLSPKIVLYCILLVN